MTAAEIVHALLFGFPPAPEMIDARWPAFLQQAGGLHLTLWVTCLALAIGLPGGVVLALWQGDGGGWRRRLAASPATALVWLVRATPVVLLVLLAAYLPYRLTGIRAPTVLWAVAAFALYAAVYASAAVRTGLRAVDARGLEAARTLGLGPWAVLWRIRLPIAVRAMLPSLAGVAITVFKDTSVLVVIGVGELMTTARQMQATEPGAYLAVLACALALYGGIAAGAGWLIRRMEHSPGGTRT